MDQITVRLPTALIDEMDREAAERPEFDSRAGVIRERCASPGEGDELRQEVEDLRTEVERLRRERRQLLEQREEHTELVKFAQEERSLAQTREDREERREQLDERRRRVSIVRRGWWRVFGEPPLPQDSAGDN